MNISFENKKILVTGGTNGIGESIAVSFYNDGAEVFITGTNQSSYEKFQKRNPNIKVNFIASNFSIHKELETLLEKIHALKFDIVINNAGINKVNSVDEISLEDFQSIQDINVKAPFLISQAAVKNMRKNKWGRIINIASVFGVVTKEKRLSYTTSKAALVGMTKTMALDLAEDNILVNAVSPGFIDTELTRRILGDEGIKEMVSKVPLKKLGTSADVAKTVLFLSSDLNNFITGQNIVLDGGFTCA